MKNFLKLLLVGTILVSATDGHSRRYSYRGTYYKPKTEAPSFDIRRSPIPDGTHNFNNVMTPAGIPLNGKYTVRNLGNSDVIFTSADGNTVFIRDIRGNGWTIHDQTSGISIRDYMNEGFEVYDTETGSILYRNSVGGGVTPTEIKVEIQGKVYEVDSAKGNVFVETSSAPTTQPPAQQPTTEAPKTESPTVEPEGDGGDLFEGDDFTEGDDLPEGDDLFEGDNLEDGDPSLNPEFEDTDPRVDDLEDLGDITDEDIFEESLWAEGGGVVNTKTTELGGRLTEYSDGSLVYENGDEVYKYNSEIGSFEDADGNPVSLSDHDAYTGFDSQPSPGSSNYEDFTDADWEAIKQESLIAEELSAFNEAMGGFTMGNFGATFGNYFDSLLGTVTGPLKLIGGLLTNTKETLKGIWDGFTSGVKAVPGNVASIFTGGKVLAPGGVLAVTEAERLALVAKLSTYPIRIWNPGEYTIQIMQTVEAGNQDKTTKQVKVKAENGLLDSQGAPTDSTVGDVSLEGTNLASAASQMAVLLEYNPVDLNLLKMDDLDLSKDRDQKTLRQRRDLLLQMYATSAQIIAEGSNDISEKFYERISLLSESLPETTGSLGSASVLNDSERYPYFEMIRQTALSATQLGLKGADILPNLRIAAPESDEQ